MRLPRLLLIGYKVNVHLLIQYKNALSKVNVTREGKKWEFLFASQIPKQAPNKELAFYAEKQYRRGE